MPKRRGPDKRPGTRQRSCKKRPADGSMPVKKKQKKDGAANPTPITSPAPVSVKSEDSGRGSDERASGGVLPVGASGHHSLSGPFTQSPRLSELADQAVGGIGGIGGTQGKSNLSLRLDMNFMDRPQSAYGSGQLSSSNSHSRTHSTQSSQSHHHLSSGSASPTTTISVHHNFSALSPHADLRFPTKVR